MSMFMQLLSSINYQTNILSMVQEINLKEIKKINHHRNFIIIHTQL